MIALNHFTLDNGLELVVHEDHNTPIAVFNILYNVGSKHEDVQKTGFAHLFEHLMFGGSENVQNYDEALHKVGGENNAFTTPDFTNYYISMPSENIETAFWVESDRMNALSLNADVLDVQKKVVTEEYKQRYLNQPYGDEWALLRPMAYKKHPYRWPVIGKDIEHVAHASLDDVKAFFETYYVPANAVLVIAGNVDTQQMKAMAEKWFGDIEAGTRNTRAIPQEPLQQEARFHEKQASVPADALYKVYHIAGRNSAQYHVHDLISDVLGRGNASRLYQKLVKEKPVFSQLNAYITGSLDPGLLLIKGRVNSDAYQLEQADEAVHEVVEELRQKGVAAHEAEKVKNQAESSLVLSEVELLNRAVNLAVYTLLGDPEQINREAEAIQAVQKQDLDEQARIILADENCSTLYYRAS